MSTNQANWTHTHSGNQHILYTNDVTDAISSSWFTPDFWKRNKSVVGESHGRSTTYFIDHKQQDGSILNMVLRRYYRGGLIGKIINNTFLYHGLKSARGAAEFLLLLKMSEMGLPVPKPIAVCVTKVWGLWCQNQILIERIKGAKDMFQVLTDTAAPESLWYEIGKVINQFHQQGVYHSDLNIHNILLDGDNHIYLIDFDKCDIRPLHTNWQQSNLARLHRSLIKEQTKNAHFHFTESNWQALLSGYTQ